MAHPFAAQPATSPAGATTPNPDSPGSLAGGDLLDAPGIFPRSADAAPPPARGPRGRNKLPTLDRPRDTHPEPERRAPHGAGIFGSFCVMVIFWIVVIVWWLA